MNHHYKGKRKNILAWLPALLLLIIMLYSNASAVKGFYFHISLTRDTIPPKKKPAQIRARATDKQRADQRVTASENNYVDTTIKPLSDTIHFKASKDSLDGPVAYHADDSMIFDVPGKKLLLYGKVSNVKYLDNELAAPLIEFDQSTNLVKAFLKKDSLGNVIAYPTFNQGDFKTKSDTIAFNMKTGKGITKGTYTQQGEMYVYGEKIKKIDKDVFYASRARFTTCNLDTTSAVR